MKRNIKRNTKKNTNKNKNTKRNLIKYFSLAIVFIMYMQLWGIWAKAEEGETQNMAIVLDNEHCYEGMNHSYQDGYEPAVWDGYVMIRVPVYVRGTLKEPELRASVNLGEINNSPFRCKNYEKTVSYTVNQLEDGSTVDSYLIQFDLELNEERFNGIYPVTVNIEGEFIQNQSVIPVSQSYTVYVNIEDGKKLEEGEETAAEGELQPQLQTQEPVYEGEICPGKDVILRIPLKNLSNETDIRNLAVTVEADMEQMEIKDYTDVKYPGDVAAGGTIEVPLTICINKNYTGQSAVITLQMSYSGSGGQVYTSQVRVKIPVKQEISLSIDKLAIQESAQVGDRIEAGVHVMNLGRNKIYNVQAKLTADGLKAEETLYLGNLEGNSDQSGTMLLSVWGLLEQESRYGMTEGKIIYSYEDEMGVEYTSEETFEFTVESPFAEPMQKEENDDTGHWWVLVSAMGGIFLICLGFVIFTIKHRKASEKEV